MNYKKYSDICDNVLLCMFWLSFIANVIVFKWKVAVIVQTSTTKRRHPLIFLLTSKKNNLKFKGGILYFTMTVHYTTKHLPTDEQ